MKFIDQKSQTSWKVLAIVCAVAILAVAGILALKTIQPAPETQVPQPTLTPSPEPQPISNQQSAIDTSGWQTYRNDEFGFEVKYPTDIEVKTGKEAEYMFGQFTEVVDISQPVAKFALSTFNPPASCNELSLGVHVYTNGEAQCDLRNKSTPETEIINGSEFYTGSSREGIPGSTYHIDQYQTLREGVCYEINIVGFGSYPACEGFERISEPPSKETLKQILSTFRFVEEIPTEVPKTQQRNYEFEKITEDFNSVDFMDRRLVEITNNGKKSIIVPSIRILMGWERVSGEAGFYPVKVSFPPYSSKIFFVKYRAGTGHSAGLFMLDTKTLEYKALPNSSEIYENYYNTLNILSPDGFLVASLQYDKLYLLDLLRDEVKALVEASVNERFFIAGTEPNYKWVDDDTIRYPVHTKERPDEIRQVSVIEL